MRPTIRRFDHVIDRLVERLPQQLYPFMHLFTIIGQPPFTVGIAATVLGYGLALEKTFYIAAGVIAIATIILSSLLKIILRRARPISDYVEKMFFKTFSFPSGHAAGALVSYGLAAYVISLRWPELTVTVWCVALAVAFMISFSRIYLRAHYASDIIGGWLVGGAGLLYILLFPR